MSLQHMNRKPLIASLLSMLALILMLATAGVAGASPTPTSATRHHGVNPYAGSCTHTI